MKLDIFTEIQKRDCAANGGFGQLFNESIAEAKAADAAGFDCWWQVEHHCATDFSYSSCPELILEAVALNTKRLRIGHAGILVPFKINHPLRAAERAAMLDHISGGRLEVGLAKSGGKEWETFQITEEDATADLVEATSLLPSAWCNNPFSWHSTRWSVQDRDVLPRPLQSPHPPLWHTCSSPSSFVRAGEMGVGVLATTMFSPVETMAMMLNGYREGVARCTQPAGRFKNAQTAVFTFVHAAASTKAAIASGAPRSALWYVSSAPRVFNVPREGFYTAIRGNIDARTKMTTGALAVAEQPDANDTSDANPVVSLLKREFAGEELSNEEIYEVISQLDSVIIGDVATCKRKMERYRDIGVDRLMCLVQMGEIPHAQVISTIQLIGQELIPYFAH